MKPSLLSPLSTLLSRADRWPISGGLLFGAAFGAVLGGAALFLIGGPAGALLCAILMGLAVPLALRNPEVEEVAGEVADEAEEAPDQPAPTLNLDEFLDMVELPGGEFLMGSPGDDREAYPDEKPRHRVRVSSFAIARTPITRALYRQVMGEEPEAWEAGDDRLPATHVSWGDAVKFCNALSERTRLEPCYPPNVPSGQRDPDANGYRLPTEAEWEYAARANTTTRYSFGDAAKDLGDYAWFRGNSDGRPHPVGEKKPNPWGLLDLHGNVWEWCEDAWDSSAYRQRTNAPEIDPVVKGPAAALRVRRGGSWVYEPRGLRSAYRFRSDPGGRDVSIGFRCVRAAGRQL